MRLVDLQPRWLEYDGRRVAVFFRCPHCRLIWLTCFFESVGSFPTLTDDYEIEGFRGSRAVRRLFYDALLAVGHPDPVEGAYHDVVSCRPTCAWTRSGDDFETLSVQPSIDASASGHWHGFITNGNIA